MKSTSTIPALSIPKSIGNGSSKSYICDRPKSKSIPKLNHLVTSKELTNDFPSSNKIVSASTSKSRLKPPVPVKDHPDNLNGMKLTLQSDIKSTVKSRIPRCTASKPAGAVLKTALAPENKKAFDCNSKKLREKVPYRPVRQKTKPPLPVKVGGKVSTSPGETHPDTMKNIQNRTKSDVTNNKRIKTNEYSRENTFENGLQDRESSIVNQSVGFSGQVIDSSSCSSKDELTAKENDVLEQSSESSQNERQLVEKTLLEPTSSNDIENIGHVNSFNVEDDNIKGQNWSDYQSEEKDGCHETFSVESFDKDSLEEVDAEVQNTCDKSRNLDFESFKSSLETVKFRSTLDLSNGNNLNDDIHSSMISDCGTLQSRRKSLKSHHLSTLSLSTLPSSLSSSLSSHLSQTFSHSFGQKLSSKLGSRLKGSKCHSMSGSTGVSWAKEISSFFQDQQEKPVRNQNDYHDDERKPASECGHPSTPTSPKKGNCIQ